MGRALLIIVSGMVIVTGIIQLAANNTMRLLPERNRDYYFEQQARNISTGLIDRAIENLKRDNEWQGSLSENAISSGSAALQTYTQTSGTYPDNISVGSWDQFKILLYSTAQIEGYTVTTEVLMQKDSFSKYSYFTDQELTSTGLEVWFWDRDVITGPIHTNSTFRMAGAPTFNGLITSPNMWQAHPTASTNPEFNGGTNFNAPLRPTPSSFQLDQLASAANNGGLRFDRRIEIDFFNQTVAGVDKGMAYIRQTNASGTQWQSWNLFDLSNYNGMISSSKRIDLKGTVTGQYTVHSEEHIEIIGDIRYNTDPRVDSTSTDLLGLVSEGNVRVDQSAHQATGSSNLDIHATIMALGTSFEVENYASGSGRGDLNLLGGIIQQNRGPVGTFSGSSLASGYNKNYVYDDRLRFQVPPNFPRESVFSILYWKDKVVERPANIN